MFPTLVREFNEALLIPEYFHLDWIKSARGPWSFLGADTEHTVSPNTNDRCLLYGATRYSAAPKVKPKVHILQKIGEPDIPRRAWEYTILGKIPRMAPSVLCISFLE